MQKNKSNVNSRPGRETPSTSHSSSPKKIKCDPEQKVKKEAAEPELKFDTTWDVEKYRREYESEDHWHLRQRFMEKNKHYIPEGKLVCLAQVFTNVELMGCKYPPATMETVERLAHDIMEEYRASRENRLKRTFITASSAAENRFKGRTQSNPTPFR